MADTHLQINADGSTVMRKTVLWPSSTNGREEVLKSLFSRNNWEISRIFNVSGSHWKVEVSCQDISYRINLYISSVRDEARQEDEFKMQLGGTYPTSEEEGWITLILGIYAISNDHEEIVDYILSAYNNRNFDFSGNPSIRGTRTKGLQLARILGFYKTDKSYLFRPDFLYYYIQNQKTLEANHSVRNALTTQVQTQDNSFYLPYLTALRTKPFMLLAGISGTGKSRIVREMAKACWTPEEDEYGKNCPRNFCMVQVKPNWHDSSDLIGYVSRINGEKYVVGPFLRFIAKAIQDPKRPYFLCLDEMNLAPVEQYFAEYLSVIESRKLQDGHIETDPIVPFENTEAYGSLIDQLFDSDEERKAYKTEEGGKRLTIPENLFVVGTVNMDETTFSFSRKVLDRAMTIEMNEVDLKGGLEAGGSKEFGYIGEDLMGDAAEGKDIYADNQTLCDEVISYLGKVNEILEGTPFKIAYRTRNEFLLYAVNRLHFATDSELWQTLDEMTSMKILSRIEGDNERCEHVLREMKNLLTETVGNHAEDSASLNKIDEMLAKLKSGYTSYWA